MTKYQAQATRKNLPGKQDYTWAAQWANGNVMLFDSEAAALDYAKSICAEPAHQMHNPRAVKVH